MQPCSRTCRARIGAHSTNIADPLKNVSSEIKKVETLLTEIAQLRTTIGVARLIGAAVDIQETSIPS